MKISIFSDTHFGYGFGTKLEDDSFDNAAEAISKSLESDIIIICGDIFDSKFPKTDVLGKALKVLAKPLSSPLFDVSETKLVSTINKKLDEISEKTLNGIPVIALHGTHERLAKDQINAVQDLEHAGFAIHLHLNGLVFEKDGIKVAIQGISGVPERYAKQVLDKWNPQPIKDCYNILLLHQSIEPFVYSPLEPPTLNLSNLPKGFDLIVNGHIHTPHLEKIDGTTLLLAGSTVITQLKEEEAKTEKGLWEIELPEKKIKFVKLDSARKFFYEVIKTSETQSLRERLKSRIEEILKNNFVKKPIIRFKIISKAREISDKELKQIENEYEQKAILRFAKQIESPEIVEKIELLKKMRGGERVSVEEMGLNILHKNLEVLKFSKQLDYDNLFRLLSDGQVEKAFDILIGEQKTITSWVKR